MPITHAQRLNFLKNISNNIVTLFIYILHYVKKAEVIKMSIYEYDKEFEEKKLRKAEFEYGQHELLKSLIQKKLAKGKSIDEIADALEESPLVVQKFIDELEYEKAHPELNL